MIDLLKQEKTSPLVKEIFLKTSMQLKHNAMPFAEAISQFIEQQFIQNSSRKTIPTKMLDLAIGRALWAIGKEEEAKSFFEMHGKSFNFNPRWVNIIATEDWDPDFWYNMFVCKILDCRKVMDIFSQQQLAWIVNIERLIRNEKFFFGISFYKAFYLLLSHFVCLWNDVSGKGVLELRNLKQAASKIEPASKKKQNKLVKEITLFTKKFLDNASIKHGWQATPQLWLTEKSS